MRKISSLGILSFLVIFFLNAQFSFSATDAQLHVIIVADTIDQGIGSAADVKLISDKAKDIAKYTEMKLNLTIIDGKKRTQSNVANAVKNLKTGPKDTVIFYYSGHGYRDESKANPWPSLYMLNDEGIDLYWVYQTLESKKPRFLLVMADCCNNTVPDGAITTLEKGFKALPIKEVYKKLFLDYKGAILASSSKPGEYSVGSSDGGQYTKQFLRALSKEFGSNDPNWDSIFKNASVKIVVDMGGGAKNVQTPQYKITNIKQSKTEEDTESTKKHEDENQGEVDTVYEAGYEKGYQDGYEQKKYNDRKNRAKSYKNGYKDGYEEGKAVYEKEQQGDSEGQNEEESAEPIEE